MARGIQHGQAAQFIGRQEPGEMFTVLERSKFEPTIQNPNRMSGPEILGLPNQPNFCNQSRMPSLASIGKDFRAFDETEADE